MTPCARRGCLPAACPRLNSHKRVSKRDGLKEYAPACAPRAYGCAMSSQAIAIVSQLSTLPGVQKTAEALSEPSALLLIGISIGGIVLGRFLSLGHRAQD